MCVKNFKSPSFKYLCVQNIYATAQYTIVAPHPTFHQQLHCHSLQLQLTPNIVKQLQPVIICKLFKMNVRVKVIYIYNYLDKVE